MRDRIAGHSFNRDIFRADYGRIESGFYVYAPAGERALKRNVDAIRHCDRVEGEHMRDEARGLMLPLLEFERGPATA